MMRRTCPPRGGNCGGAGKIIVKNIKFQRAHIPGGVQIYHCIFILQQFMSYNRHFMPICLLIA